MLVHYLPVLVILLAGLVYALLANKLTPAAAIGGAVIGFLLFYTTGYGGLLMMALFFVVGTIATSWKLSFKRALHLSEENKGQRTLGQVLANAGVPALLATAILFDESHLLIYSVMIAASFASATADTLSSEMGNVYGSRFYNIKTLKRDTRGLNGVISLEGTLFGIAGSCLIACCYCIFNGSSHYLWLIITAGTAGNFLDSFLGATLERKQILNNNGVNFLNTAFGAVVAGVLFLF